MVHYMGASPEVGYTSVRSDVGEEFVSLNARSFAVLLHKQLTDWMSLGEGCDVGLLYMRNDFEYSGQDYAVRRVGGARGTPHWAAVPADRADAHGLALRAGGQRALDETAA